jgi:hypothetical protein
MRQLVILFFLIVGGLGGFFIYSPYHASEQLQVALQQGDAAQIEELTDFNSVRKSLRDQLSPKANQDDSFLKKLGKNLIGGISDAIIDSMVTPDGLQFLMAGQYEEAKKGKLSSSKTVQFATEQGFKSPTLF